ncbi:MAG: GNAT family protein [Sediminibacterium sp.]
MTATQYSCLQNNTYSNGDFAIKTIDDSYIQVIRQWRNSQLNILRQDKIISEEQQIKYFKEFVFSQLTNAEPAQVLFNFFHKDVFIGYGGIVHISQADQIGEISFLLDPLSGTAFYDLAFTNFLALMDRIAFAELKLEKLFTETYETRIENVDLLEKAGYDREGVLRSHKMINGKRVDIYLHGRLKNEVK